MNKAIEQLERLTQGTAEHRREHGLRWIVEHGPAVLAALKAQVRQAEQILSRYTELFPPYAYTDSRCAIDLMAAEIVTLRKELAQANAALAAQEAASIECGLVLIKRAESAERRAEEATRVLQQLVAHDVAADKRQRLQNCFELDVARAFLAQEKL